MVTLVAGFGLDHAQQGVGVLMITVTLVFAIPPTTAVLATYVVLVSAVTTQSWRAVLRLACWSACAALWWLMHGFMIEMKFFGPMRSATHAAYATAAVSMLVADIVGLLARPKV